MRLLLAAFLVASAVATTAKDTNKKSPEEIQKLREKHRSISQKDRLADLLQARNLQGGVPASRPAATEGGSYFGKETFPVHSGANTTTAGDQVGSQPGTASDGSVINIIGGDDADPEDYPYYARLFRENGSFLCGSFLIHEDILVTAAHCIGDIAYAEIGPDGEFFWIKEQVEHPFWNPIAFTYDYAVLKLVGASYSETIDINGDPSIPEAGDELIGIGFGDTSPGFGVPPDTLQEAVFDYTAHDECNVLREAVGRRIHEEIEMCVGDVAFGEPRSCFGDSGGPVIHTDSGTVVGLTSYGAGDCAVPRLPSIYARTSGGYDWIQQQVCCLSGDPPDGCDLTECDDTCVSSVNGWHDFYGGLLDCDRFEQAPGLCDSLGSFPNYGYTADEVCCACGGGIDPAVETPLETDDICDDLFEPWYDQFGNTCAAYISFNRCQDFFEPDPQYGYFANEACCGCGGGSVEYGEGFLKPFCLDKTQSNGDPWHDSDGTRFTCQFYASEQFACLDFGDRFENFGLTANEACCICGGGTDPRPPPPPPPTSTPTTSPTKFDFDNELPFRG